MTINANCICTQDYVPGLSNGHHVLCELRTEFLYVIRKKVGPEESL